jgi:hypothetical protein
MLGLNRKRAAMAGSLAIVCALTLASCTYLDPRATIDLREGLPSSVYLLAPPERPTDVTDNVCPSRWGCEKAAESKRVRIMKFSTYPKAQVETYKLARSGFRSDRLVIEFLDPAVTDEEWRLVTSVVDGTSTFSPD